jgi:hypothetical protein
MTQTFRETRRRPEYTVWSSMRARCRDLKNKRYGGRGIGVCNRWDSFAAFLSDMGPRPSSKHSIDRKDNDGNYTPENCRWATRKEQMANMSRNRRLTFKGETMLLIEWERRTGLNGATIQSRIDAGMSVEDALTLPPNPLGQRIPRMLTHDGRTQRMAQWARELGISSDTLRRRLVLGWTLERAMLLPVAPSDRPATKLTEAEVLEIRRRAKGGESSRKLAREFGVCGSNVRQICARQTWTNL